MEYDNIKDSRLAHFLQRYIVKSDQSQNPKLKNVKLCGSQLMHQKGTPTRMYLTTNGKASHFLGVTRCNSVWSCPICMPVNTAKKAARIGGAIDALAKHYNQYACMITFTLPHMAGMTLAETFTILRQTWRDFAKTTTEKRMQNGYLKGANAYGRFRDQLQVRHYAKMYEVTWGKNSWHPHIHCLFWTPNDKFNKIADHESDLFELWWHYAKVNTRKVLRKSRTKDEAESVTARLFADSNKYPKDGHRALYISKTKDGDIRKVSSANYLAGFTKHGEGAGENELTALHYKDAKGDNMTPYQMLVKAYRNKKLHNMYMRLYLEFATYTNGVRRFAFSRGLNKIVDKWFESNEYIETLQKKSTVEETALPWKVVCYFNEEEWQNIIFLDHYCENNLRDELLDLALEREAITMITNLLAEYNIKPHLPDDQICTFIEREILNAG